MVQHRWAENKNCNFQFPIHDFSYPYHHGQDSIPISKTTIHTRKGIQCLSLRWLQNETMNALIYAMVAERVLTTIITIKHKLKKTLKILFFGVTFI